MWLIEQVRSILKMILNFCDWLNRVPTMTKTRNNNYVTNHIDMTYIENETKLLWPIELGVVCDENQT